METTEENKEADNMVKEEPSDPKETPVASEDVVINTFLHINVTLT